MATVKLTKNEQKKQKDLLKQFLRYLPTLQLKKQQLQIVIRQIESEAKMVKAKQEQIFAALKSWIDLFGENEHFEQEINLNNLIEVDQVVRTKGNIAGVTIPVFNDLTFKEIEYSLFESPLWIDYAIETMQEIGRLDAEIETLNRQIELLEHELRSN